MTTTSQSDSLVYTLAETAVLLKLSRPSVYRGIKSGEIPSVRIGSRILVPKAKLLALLASESTAPARGKGEDG